VADALGLDVGQDLSDRVGRRTIRGDHHLQRLGVVHDRTERLTELASIELVSADIISRRLASAASARFLRLSLSARCRARRWCRSPMMRSDWTVSAPMALSTVPPYALHRLGAR
jgi:hypothetical protein